MDLSKNNPDLVKAYEGYTADYYAKYGRQPTITSAARTDEKQAELYARWQAGDKGVFMPAKPRGDGSIRHQYALDLRQADIDDSLLKKNGLWRPFGAKDPVHIELAGSKNGKQVGTPMTTAGTTATPAATTPAVMGGSIEGTLQNILGLLTQGQGAARAEGQIAGKGAYEAGVTAQAQANRQADYLTAAGLNTPTDPSFLQTMMQQTQQQMMQLGSLQQERTQFVQSMGGVTGAIDLAFGKGTSTFAYDGAINEVDSALKQSQAAMQQYLANTSTVAAMGQKTIASISMAEAIAKQKALEAQAESNAIKYGLKGQEVMLGALERQEQRDISQERVDKLGMGTKLSNNAGAVMQAWGLPGDYVKASGNVAQAKAITDTLKRNPSVANPDNLDPKLQSTADATIIHTQLGQNNPSKVLKATLDSAFGVGGYAAGAYSTAKNTFNAAMQGIVPGQGGKPNKEFQKMSPAQAAGKIGEMVRDEATAQMLSIDPRDDTNMYRADWNAMATAPGASVFRGPIGQQVLGDVKKLTTAEARRTYNDKIVLERAVQMVKSGVITIDQATEELGSLFAGAAKFNNATKKYESIGLLPQTSYMSTLRSNPSIGSFRAAVAAFPFLGDAEEIRKRSGVKINNLAEQATPGKSVAPGVDMTDPAIVRRVLLGEMIAERVATISSVPPPQLNRMAGADPLTTNTTPEQP